MLAAAAHAGALRGGVRRVRGAGLTRSRRFRAQAFRDAEVVRTRDAARLAELDVIIDVGAVYDPGACWLHAQAPKTRCRRADAAAARRSEPPL